MTGLILLISPRALTLIRITMDTESALTGQSQMLFLLLTAIITAR